MEGSNREVQGFRRLVEKLIRFGTFNIRNGWNRGLELALCGVEQRRVDCGVFQEANLTKGVYVQESRLLGDGNRGAERSFRRRCDFLPWGGALFCWRAPSPRPERHRLSAGDGETAVACSWVIYRPHQCLNHRGSGLNLTGPSSWWPAASMPISWIRKAHHRVRPFRTSSRRRV